MPALDVARLKQDFPIFEREVNGKRLVYLDSASSSQKPNAVLDAMDDCYRRYYANIHRGVYSIAEEATAAFEDARRKVARFINARRSEEVVFTRNATEAINLVAYTWARANLGAGDVIVLSHMEHHANVVPWHMLAAERGVELRWIPLTEDFRLDLSHLDQLLDGAKLLAISAMSNVLGTINEIRPLADAAHAAGAHVLVDVCQFVPHVADRRPSVGRRLHRVLRAQAARPEWHRRALGPIRAARGDATVPGWRRDDPGRPARWVHDE